MLGEGERVRVHFLVARRRRAAGGRHARARAARSSSSRARGTTSCASCSVAPHGRGAADGCWPTLWLPRFPAHYKGYTAPEQAAHDIACFTRLLQEGEAQRRQPPAAREETRVCLYKCGGQGRALAGHADARGPRPAGHRGDRHPARGRRRRGLGAGVPRARPRRPSRSTSSRPATASRQTHRGRVGGRGGVRPAQPARDHAPGWTATSSRSCAPTASTASGSARASPRATRTRSWRPTPALTAKLVRYFEARFDPVRARARRPRRTSCATRSSPTSTTSSRSTTTASCATSSR